MKRLTFFTALMVMVFGLVVPAQATLVDMNDGTIYDTDTQLSWLQDAGYGGGQSWASANAWAANLNYAGLTGWRLPISDGNCGDGNGTGYNCTGSELGHLYYIELGNPAGAPYSPGWMPNMGPFTNAFAPGIGGVFWTGTTYTNLPTSAFAFWLEGFQRDYDKSSVFSVWPVRPGFRSINNVCPGTNVTATPTPDSTLTFGSVTACGTLSVTELTNSSPPANFKIPSGQSYNITFNGNFNGSVQVCFTYNEDDVGNENNLKLYHRTATGWEDITVPDNPPDNPNPDTVNNIICGLTTSFSEFAVVEPLSSPTPVGYNPAWLAVTLMSLIVVGGFLIRRKTIQQ